MDGSLCGCIRPQHGRLGIVEGDVSCLWCSVVLILGRVRISKPLS